MSALHPRSAALLKRRCALCLSTKQVEANHVGGRNHIAWFTSPLCRKHHDEFHRRLELSRIDLRYTPNKQERLRRARQATFIFLWMLEECLANQSEELS